MFSMHKSSTCAYSTCKQTRPITCRVQISIANQILSLSCLLLSMLIDSCSAGNMGDNNKFRKKFRKVKREPPRRNPNQNTSSDQPLPTATSECSSSKKLRTSTNDESRTEQNYVDLGNAFVDMDINISEAALMPTVFQQLIQCAYI